MIRQNFKCLCAPKTTGSALSVFPTMTGARPAGMILKCIYRQALCAKQKIARYDQGPPFLVVKCNAFASLSK